MRIGKNCIIGAGAIVIHSIPDDSVAAGIPARVIGSTWDYAEKKINGMPENWDSEEFRSNMAEYLKKVLPEPEKADAE